MPADLICTCRLGELRGVSHSSKELGSSRRTLREDRSFCVKVVAPALRRTGEGRRVRRLLEITHALREIQIHPCRLLKTKIFRTGDDVTVLRVLYSITGMCWWLRASAACRLVAWKQQSRRVRDDLGAHLHNPECAKIYFQGDGLMW